MIKLNDNLIKIRSLCFSGSVKKAERVLRVTRSWLPLKEKDFKKKIASLRFSCSRRAKDISSFLEHLNTSYGIERIQQIYTESKRKAKRFRWKHTGVITHIRRGYKLVALVTKDQTLDKIS